MKHKPNISHDAALVEQLKADPAFATVINLLVAQQDRLLNLHLAGGIDLKTFADKQPHRTAPSTTQLFAPQ